jgi:hypothetical protein
VVAVVPALVQVRVFLDKQVQAVVVVRVATALELNQLVVWAALE